MHANSFLISKWKLYLEGGGYDFYPVGDFHKRFVQAHPSLYFFFYKLARESSSRCEYPAKALQRANHPWCPILLSIEKVKNVFLQSEGGQGDRKEER